MTRPALFSRALVLSILLMGASWNTRGSHVVSAFVVSQSPLRRFGSSSSGGGGSSSSNAQKPFNDGIGRQGFSLKKTQTDPTSSSSSALHMAPILSFVKSATMPLTTPIARRLLLVLGTAMLFLSKQYKRILWPGSCADPALSEPLPPGSMGCPFFGSNIMSGSRDYGPYVFFERARQTFDNPSLLKLYAFGMPMVSVSGADNIKSVLKDEFDPNGVNSELVGEAYLQVFGNQSILYESDKTKHGALRRLVGAAMTPVAVSNAVPAIQQAANAQIDQMLTAQSTVKMENICNDFTLDVAWRQILGLDLTEEEIPEFYKNVKQWISGIFNPLFMLPFKVPGIRFTKSYKAHEYLVSLVEEKLAYLDENGPDGSTLSGIYFATDEDNDSRKLARQQVIDNALILIVAGSETSASTLTLASLALGLHPDVWNKVKREQASMIVKCGNEITSKAQLDAECPYLDSVIKETLRLRPIPSIEIRRTAKSIVLDGMQIPKNWLVMCNVRNTHDNDPVTMENDGSHMDMKLGFAPERWDSAETKPSQWMPFGIGARRCLGENLAMTEMKVFLATLARRVDYDLARPTDEILWKRMSVMPRPLDGVKVSARPAAAVTVP